MRPVGHGCKILSRVRKACTVWTALLQARSLLSALSQDLANTPLDSPERFKARALLPGMAKRLRDLGPAVGAVIDVLGATDHDQLSSRYGGDATSASKSEAVYQSIGKTITISGR